MGVKLLFQSTRVQAGKEEIKYEICAQIQAFVKILVFTYSSVLPLEKYYGHSVQRGRENPSYYTFNSTPICFCVLLSAEERIAVVLIHWSLTRWS